MCMILGKFAIPVLVRKVKRLHTRHGKGQLLIVQPSFTTSLPNARRFIAPKHDASYINIPIVNASSRAQLVGGTGGEEEQMIF